MMRVVNQDLTAESKAFLGQIFLELWMVGLPLGWFVLMGTLMAA